MTHGFVDFYIPEPAAKTIRIQSLLESISCQGAFINNGPRKLNYESLLSWILISVPCIINIREMVGTSILVEDPAVGVGAIED